MDTEKRSYKGAFILPNERMNDFSLLHAIYQFRLLWWTNKTIYVLHAYMYILRSYVAMIVFYPRSKRYYLLIRLSNVLLPISPHLRQFRSQNNKHLHNGMETTVTSRIRINNYVITLVIAFHNVKESTRDSQVTCTIMSSK